MSKQFSEQVAEITITEECAIHALSMICQLKLEPTPEIYNLWYSYYKEDDCDLRNRMDEIVKQNDNVELRHFDSVLSNVRKDNMALTEFHTDVSQVINDTFQNADDISENTKSLGDYINEISSSEGAEAQEIIEEIVKKSNVAMETNERLTARLSEQQKMVASLQEEYERVRNELITDNLTKVHNRRHLDDRLPKLIEIAVQTKRPLSLLMFDIDHFKKFNDTHGHLVGDTVLKFVGHMMRQLFPDNADNLFRYGGEEFTIIFPDMGRSEAHKFATQLLNAIGKKEITKKTTNENIGNVTISGGIAELTKKEDALSLIKRADEALYASKRNGRNQMTTAK
ncbi:MAG: diguanylate cyclase [Pseudomonadota bacterium]